MSFTTSVEQSISAASDLAPVLPSRWALTWRQLAVCSAFCGLFLYLNYAPVIQSDTWVQAALGRTTVTSWSLPTVDAAQPFTEGMKIVSTSWLSDATIALAERFGGREAAFHMIAVTGTLLFAALAWLFHRQARSLPLTLASLVMVWLLGVRPATLSVAELFGLLCLTAMLAVIQSLLREEARADEGQASDVAAKLSPAWRPWVLLGGIQLAWTNLHASFPVGIAVLACYALGRGLEAPRGARRPIAVLGDRFAQRWILLAELAAILALITPYGFRLPAELWRILTSVPMRTASPWPTLQLTSVSGLAFLASFALLAAILRRSRRRVLAAEVILWSVGALAVAVTSRAVPWYAVIWTFALLPHVADVWAQRPARDAATQRTASAAGRFSVTLACVAVVWVTFCLSPVSSGLLGRAAQTKRQLGTTLPAAVVDHLRQQAEPQVVFAPVEWADWLAWDQAPKVGAMMTSNVQWVPRKVWLDYQRVLKADAGWQQALERYHVDCLLVHTSRQPELARAVRLSQRWQVTVEAEGALLAVPRRKDAGSTEHESEPADPVSEHGGEKSGIRPAGWQAAVLGFLP